MKKRNKNKREITYLHISAASTKPEMEPVFWYFTGNAMNENRFSTVQHIDSRKISKL